MHDNAVEPIRDGRAGRAPRLVIGSEHEMIDEELRTSLKEVHERDLSLAGLELILLVDPNPRQLLPAQRKLVAATRQLFLFLQQLDSRGEPLVSRPCLMLRHCSYLRRSGVHSLLDVAGDC